MVLKIDWELKTNEKSRKAKQDFSSFDSSFASMKSFAQKFSLTELSVILEKSSKISCFPYNTSSDIWLLCKFVSLVGKKLPSPSLRDLSE